MSFDWTTFALQLVNVLVLLFILQRYLFKPVAGIIAERQAKVQAAMDAAAGARARAEAATAEAEAEARRNAAARADLLARARDEAEAERAAILHKARDDAARILAEARDRRDRDTRAGRAQSLALARDLAVDIARRVLSDRPSGFTGYLDRLERALNALSEAERGALLSGGNLRLVSAEDLPEPQRKAALAALNRFGAAPAFATDPGLIAGLELWSDNGVLHNSMAHDLDQIAEAMRDDRAA